MSMIISSKKHIHLSKPISAPLYLVQFIVSQQKHVRELNTKPGPYLRRRNKKENDERNRNQEEKEDRGESVYLNKSKGQHLLTNPRILDAIVRKSSIKPTDTVLEIGPGTGNLTLRLLEIAERVVAVEIDKRMVEVLHKRICDRGLRDKIDILQEDALKVEFPYFDLVVANIPYGISSPLISKLVFSANPFRSATLLLQKEFARRLLSNPGDSEFNRLAVNVKLVAEVEFVMDVSKRDFLPCPKVDSSVVIIRPKKEVPDVNIEEWLAFTRMCFGKKNKTLGATFKQKRKVGELLRLSKMRDSCTESAASRQSDVCGDDAKMSEQFFDNDDDGDDREEEKEDCNDGRSSSLAEVELRLFKKKIIEVLRAGGFEDKRPSKLCNEELLNLLSLLNQAGIYFHDQSRTRNADCTSFDAD